MANIAKELKKALDSECAHSIEEVLKDKKEAHYKSLISLLADKQKNLAYQTRAIYLLGRWNKPSAVKAIAIAMPALDEVGRISAVDALGRIGSKDAFKEIIACTKDDSPNVRKFAAIALSRYTTAPAKKRLKEISKEDETAFVRTTAKRLSAEN